MNYLELGDLIKIKKGKKLEEVQSISGSAIRYIQIEDLRTDENLKYASKDGNVIECNSNDILIAWDGANAGTVGFGLEGAIGSTLAKLVLIKKFYTPFVGRLLQSKFEFIRNTCTGATIPHVSKSALLSIQIPDICFQEQKRIADLLDKADALRKKNKELLAAYDELLKATFLDMFGDPVSNPKEWKRIKLGDFGNWRSGGTPSRTVKEYYDGNIPWLSSGELESLFVSESNEKITEKAISESAAKKIEIGSLLLGMYDTAALKSSINTSIVTCNQAIAFAKLDDTKINTLFAYTQIQLGKEFFRSKQRGVRQKNLNLSMIKSIELIYPPLSLQNKFACIVKNIEAQKVLVKQSLQESEDLFNGLVQNAFKD